MHGNRDPVHTVSRQSGLKVATADPSRLQPPNFISSGTAEHLSNQQRTTLIRVSEFIPPQVSGLGRTQTRNVLLSAPLPGQESPHAAGLLLDLEFAHVGGLTEGHLKRDLDPFRDARTAERGRST